MKVLVTGANGFVGSWMVHALLDAGHEVTGAVGREGAGLPLPAAGEERVEWIPLNLRDPRSVAAVASHARDAVVHLAGIASVGDSLQDPVGAWEVNALGTERLLEGLRANRDAEGHDPTVLLVSTGEVYGPNGEVPRREGDAIAPCSPYAESKAAAEIAGLGAWRRSGLRVIVARAFPHTGPGQSTRFVLPALAARVLSARRRGTSVVRAGNLEPVRDMVDVRDVVRAYLALLERGDAGEIYNVARGEGVRLSALLDRLAALIGHPVTAEADPSLVRPADIPHLVGDATKLQRATGWTPLYSMDQTLRDLIDAQTD